jgi:TPR repeat protein
MGWGSLGADPEDPASRRWREDRMESAMEGHVPSMLSLGDRYLIEGEKELAKKWYREAADLQVSEGLWKIIGIEERRPLSERAKDMEKLYRELMSFGESRGSYRLGRLYTWPKSPLRDPDKGRLHLEDAASQGVLEAKLLLGKLFLGTWNHPQNFQRAIDWLSQAAKSKSAEANRHLGMIYRYGLGAKQDLEKAWGHYSTAARLKDGESMFIIAEALYLGKDISKDLPRAHRYYLQASEQGHLKARDRLREKSFTP